MKKILIVDDAAFMRISLKRILESSGFQVVGKAENGAVGVMKYKQLKPDVVTMHIIKGNKKPILKKKVDNDIYNLTERVTGILVDLKQSNSYESKEGRRVS